MKMGIDSDIEETTQQPHNKKLNDNDGRGVEIFFVLLLVFCWLN